MKFAIVTLLAALVNANEGEHLECTHGKLYVFDDASSKVHVIDVSSGVKADLTISEQLDLPSEGAGMLEVYGHPGDPLVVQYRGLESNGYDGFVRVIDTGYNPADVSYEPPSIVQNAIIDDDCNRPIHQVRNDDKIAIFCDGSFDMEVNTTIHVIDTTKLGGSESAIVQSVTLQGAHHGVAIPVDDGHLLHSIATPERILRDETATSLPATFQVVDLQGTTLHQIANLEDPNANCEGFHGSAPLPGNTFVLACNDVHGGVVIVNYDPATESYTSRALLYPDDPKFDGMRVGSFAYHYNAEYVVGSFSVRGGQDFYLMAFQPDATVIEESNLIKLPGNQSQCIYQYDVGAGEYLNVFMPNGMLHVFEIENGSFQQVAQKEIVPGMTSCSESVEVSGIGQFFVGVPATNKLFAMDLGHADHGEIDVYETTLPATPRVMTVSGFSLDTACVSTHDHDDDKKSGVSLVTTLPLLGFILLTSVVAMV